MRRHVSVLIALALLGVTPALSQDGGGGGDGSADSTIFRKNVSKTPDTESDHAQLSMLQFWVPATKADGTSVTLEYERPDGTLLTRDHAKPLVVTYLEEEETGAASYDILTGEEVFFDIRRDAWCAYSLDDGATWKDGNLSESALESSFRLADGRDYPGDVMQVVHAVAGNKILVAWVSKYADQGSPRYSVKDELDADGDGDVDEPLYRDLFDVAGSQGSIDYTEWMHHGDYPFAHIGEIPFGAVWTARGTVEQVADPQTGELRFGIRWRKPERLTSGKRDAYYLAIDGVEGAGFVLAWQEDPEGLRPGYGEGPGVGWSGATVNHKTDIWYSSIAWDDFDAVDTTDQSPDTNKPKVAERMTMPCRISDNLNALADRVDSDGNPHPAYIFELDENADGIPDLYDHSVQWINSQGELKNICVAQDGRLLNGQTGASRPRMALEGYTRADGTKSAWVLLAYEETKGLGAGEGDEEPLDLGKDVMYHSFDMSAPELAAPGTMMNMPETDPSSASEYPTFRPFLVNDAGENQYQTTIGRRPSLVVQPGYKIAAAAADGTVGGMTSAIVLYKDGEQRQGGPSDVFMRRFELPADFDPATDNPYDVRHLVFDEADTDILATSPSAYPASAYPNGVPTRGAVNLSGSHPLTFEALDNVKEQVTAPSSHDASTTGACSNCHSDIDDDGYQLPSHGITQRVLTWTQTAEDLGDESWENPYEVAKGHRGFIDGDFVMIMYAYSPNWLATSKGHEPYNLFIRRSFDGGRTWTTTPAALGGDGTTYDQVCGVGDRAWTETRVLAPGEFEPARNVSQITSSKDTVLDPRYSPTNLGTQRDIDRVLQADGTYLVLAQSDPLFDRRDPSKFFAVYETGDATVLETVGEADPWDLYGSRATAWGDDWQTVDVYAQGQGIWQERWDWLENKDETRAGEASVALSPDGRFAWVVWNQWIQDEDMHVTEADPIFRRLWWDDPVTLAAVAGSYEADEGETVDLLASAVYDGDLTTLVYDWDLDSDGVFETLGRGARTVATGSSQAVAVRVTDGAGHQDVNQGWINARGHAPRVWGVEAFPPAIAVGGRVTVTARFADPGKSSDHVAWIDWRDGRIEPAAMTDAGDGGGPASVTGTHRCRYVGRFAVKVGVTDAEGKTGWDVLRHLVVYDRSRGFLATGARLVAPTGTCDGRLDADVRYPSPDGAGRDVTRPVGRLLFRVGDRPFEATAFDWLIVTANGRILLTGDAASQGQPGFRFLVSAVDGNPDLLRVRIWIPNGLDEQVVYDSQGGAPDNALPTGELCDGRIEATTVAD